MSSPLARRGSMASVRSLEDLLTCPIHMDLLEDARSLPCGHVFCRSCLDRMPHSHELECPICRAKHPMPCNGAAGLPAMYSQNRIVQYIAEKKQDMALRSLQASTTESKSEIEQERDRHYSISTKTDLLKKLVEDISSHQSDGSAVDQAGRRVCIEELNSLLQALQRDHDRRPQPSSGASPDTRRDSTHLSDSELTTSSIVELHSVDHQRRMMHRRCLYKRELRIDLRQVLRGLQVTCVDFLETNSRVRQDRYTAVLLEANHERIYVLSHINGSTRFTRLEPRVGSQMSSTMKVHYLQCLNGCVHLCVEYVHPDLNTRVGMMLQCDISGRVLSRSPVVPAREDFDVGNVSHPPICGFYYDHVAHEYLVTRPSEGKISLWGDDYRSKCDYNFDCHEAHPYYVVRVHDNHEVWMSCPTDKIIVILDEVTNVWKKLDTAAIYDSVPGHLTITTDGRIIFVDVREQRLFWMTRMGNNLPVQRLIFRRVNLSRLVSRYQQHFCCIRGLSNDQLMLAMENYLFVFRPGGNLNSFECCML